MKGRILWYDSRYGHGIIEDDAGNEYYFDSSVWKCSVSNPSRNRLVKFETRFLNKTLCAFNVRDLLG